MYILSLLHNELARKTDRQISLFGEGLARTNPNMIERQSIEVSIEKRREKLKLKT